MASAKVGSGASPRRGVRATFGSVRRIGCTEALGVDGLVLLPQQREGDALAAAFGVNASPIGNRALDASGHRGGGEQPPFERALVEPLRQRPGQPGGPRRMYSPTVEGEAWIERAMARIDSPASKNSRSTRGILRMDNLLKAIDISSLKGTRRCHDEELSRAARSFRADARNDSGHRRQVIGLGPESLIGFVRNQ